MKTKKLFAVLLSAAMLLTMGTSAFAANSAVNDSVSSSATSSTTSSSTGSTTSDTGTITINNATSGETYSAYLMFTLESYDKDTGAYSYSIDTSSQWYGFVSGSGTGASYVTLKQAGTGSTKYYVTWTDESDGAAAAFAKAALAYATKIGINPTQTTTASSDTATLSGLDLGYYLVKSSLGTLAMLETTDTTATITEKNSVPTVKKEVLEDSTGLYGTTNTADIGDTVSFKTTITVGAGSGYIVLHDYFADGLEYDYETFHIYQDSIDPSNCMDTGYADCYDYFDSSIPFDDSENPVCDFELVFQESYLDSLPAGTKIIITYNATVTSDAVIDGADNTNTTWLAYGNDYEETSEKSTTTTYVYDVDIFKYTGADTALPGASFLLYKTVDGTNNYAIVENGKLTGWTTTKTAATTLISADDGTISVDGLDADTYYLEETAAPDGYNKLEDPVQFIIDNDGNVTDKDGNALTNDIVKIENNTGSKLPTTGGIGTTIFYIVGGLLVVGAAVFLVVRRRMSSEK